MSLYQVAIAYNLRQRTNDIRLERKVHGQVGMLPVADDTKANKTLALAIHLLRRIVAASLAELRWFHLLTRFTDLLFDGQFNRQSMAIPTRDIGGIKSAERTRLDDNVFKDLV